MSADRVTRVEVIDHRKQWPSPASRRVFVAYDVAVELSYQDDGRTLKVFVMDAISRKLGGAA